MPKYARRRRPTSPPALPLPIADRQIGDRTRPRSGPRLGQLPDLLQEVRRRIERRVRPGKAHLQVERIAGEPLDEPDRGLGTEDIEVVLGLQRPRRLVRCVAGPRMDDVVAPPHRLVALPRGGARRQPVDVRMPDPGILSIGQLDRIDVPPTLEDRPMVVEVTPPRVQVRLADDRGPIAGIAKVPNVAGHRFGNRDALVGEAPVLGDRQPRRQADPRGPTQRGVGDAGLEPNRAPGKRVEVRGRHGSTAGNPQRIGAELIEQHDDDRSHRNRASTSAGAPCGPRIGSAPPRRTSMRCS